MLADKNRLGRPLKYKFFATLGVGEMEFVEGKDIRQFSSTISHHNAKDDGKRWQSLGRNEDGTRASVGGVEGIYIRRIH